MRVRLIGGPGSGRCALSLVAWAEDYDREFNDVFAIQEDIARVITASLHMTLGLKPGENLVNNRKIDPQAYTEYLRIRANVTAVQTGWSATGRGMSWKS